MGDYKSNPNRPYKVKTPKRILKRIAMYDRKNNRSK